MEDYRTYKLNRKETILLILSTITLGTGVGWLFFNTLTGVIFSPGIFFLMKDPIEKNLMNRRRRDLRNQFRDALYSFSSSFAAGAHMEEAIEIAYIQISDIYGKDSDMAKELMYMNRKMRETAGIDTELWENFAYRTGLEDIEDFSQVFSACRDAGGDLVKAVDRASVIIVDKINIENEMRTLFSQKKNEGRMMGIMPVVMILFLRITSPSYLNVMYSALAGRILMILALGAMIYAIYLTEKITRIEV